MKRTVKIGLIGTGEIGRVHAEAWSRIDGTELSIAALIQPDAEKRFSEQYGAKLYPSLETLLADEAVEAVDICLPNDLHCQYALKAFEAGKHVFCEKPIALSLEEADAMIEEHEVTRQAQMVAEKLRNSAREEAATTVNTAKTQAEELLTSSRKQAEETIVNARKKAEELNAGAEKWSSELCSAASNYVDEVMKKADEALVIGVNEIRNARQNLRTARKEPPKQGE